MRWRFALGLALAAPSTWALYACTSDTFGGTDGGDAGSVTTADFCDAEANYYARCDPRSCNSGNVANCGTMFYDINPAVAKAIVDCEAASAIPCQASGLFGTLEQSSCILNELDGKLTTPAVTTLAQDFCSHCAPSSPSCVAQFAQVNPAGPGLVAALFSTTIVDGIDQQCTPQLDAGTGDGGLAACTAYFLQCELYSVAVHTPPNPCRDAGPD